MNGIGHKEALTDETLSAWRRSGFLSPKGFYLAGGTALAMQIGHRKSVDLDFFNDEPIKKTLLGEIEEKFDDVAQVTVKTKNELTVFMQGVKLTFLHYPFELLYPTVQTSSVPIASVRDIASMKAYSLGRRQSLKDYVDLYTIVKRGDVTLTEIIADCQKKYSDAFNDRFFLEQLLYTDDLEEEEIIWIIEAVSKAEVKRFFEKKVKEIK